MSKKYIIIIIESIKKNKRIIVFDKIIYIYRLMYAHTLF